MHSKLFFIFLDFFVGHGILFCRMKTTSIHIRISKEKHQAIKTLAKKDNRKMTAIIDIAIDRYLREREKSLNNKE